MTITNERLRELSIDEWTWASNIEERMAIARELLAARERIERFEKFAETSPSLRAWRDDLIARAEKAEAERDGWKQTAAAENEALFERNNDVERIAKERDAARAELAKWPSLIAEALSTRVGGRDIAPEEWAGHVRREHEAHTRTSSCLDAARAEVERLRAELEAAKAKRTENVNALVAVCDDANSELADLRAYRDRTEAALVTLSKVIPKEAPDLKWGQVGLPDLRRLGLARDAKGEAK